MQAAENLILTITDQGAGKLSSSHDYPVRGRGGMGVQAMDKAMRGGALIASFPVEMDDQIMLATSRGQSIRVPVQGISFRSRNAGGVKVFNTGKGEHVVSVAWIAEQSGPAAAAFSGANGACWVGARHLGKKMSATSSERLHRVRALSRGSSHSLTRLLIASYFLASVMGIIRDPVLHTMLSAHGSSVALQLLLVSSVTITALMVMFAHFVRPAALFLAVFTLWSAVLHFGPGWSPDALGSLWLQLALTSALVLVATDAPAAGPGRRRNRSRHRRRRHGGLRGRMAGRGDGRGGGDPRDAPPGRAPSPTRPAACRNGLLELVPLG
jgi:uncharacterized membrane protein YphA (DoxX/SURF4 family)